MKTQTNTSHGKLRIILVAFLITLLLAGCTPNKTNSSVHTQELAEPLGAVTAAKFNINAGTGNLTLDGLSGDEPLLAAGLLEYLDDQGLPERSLTVNKEQAVLKWAAVGALKTRFHFPWENDNGATEWQIHLHPKVAYDLTAQSGGGNVDINLGGLVVSNLNAITDGGTVNVTLPDQTADLSVTAKSGGGNVTVEIGRSITGSHTIDASSGAGSVTVRLPKGTTARIHVSTGIGKLIIDSQFIKVDDKTYQSPDYDNVTDRVEIFADSGAGKVTIETFE